ncbi:hypothetical protein QWY82_06645 [Simiduia curdlanivorans]|nr:hypothetical protein [Simiduia curdlanivorans]
MKYYQTLQQLSPLQKGFFIVFLGLSLQYSLNALAYFGALPDIGEKSLNSLVKNSTYWIPVCMALFGSFLFKGKEGVVGLFRPYATVPLNPIWWLTAIFILTPVVYASVLLNDLLYGNPFNLYAITPPTSAELIHWTPMFIQVAVSDELFWIGFLYPLLLQAGYSSLKASLVIGVLWGVDYIPFMFTGFFVSPGLNGASILLGFFSLAPMYIWLYEKTKSALIPITFNVSMQYTFSAIPTLPHVTGDNSAVSMANLLCFIVGMALWYFYPCYKAEAKPQTALSERNLIQEES